MQVTVNGKAVDVEGSVTVQGLLEQVGTNPGHTAVMINGDIVARDCWNERGVEAHDTVEIVVLSAGG